MADPIIYLDRSTIREGRLDELRAAIRELAEFVERQELQLLAYAAYLDEREGRMTVLHVHRDAASLERPMKVAGGQFARFAELVELRHIDVYGAPNAATVASLHGKARQLGNASVSIHPFEAGFVRDAG